MIFARARGAPGTALSRDANPRFEPYRPQVKDIAGLAGANSLKLLLLLLQAAAAEADDREFVYIEMGNLVPELSQSIPELPQSVLEHP